MTDPQPAAIQLRDLAIGYRRLQPVLAGLTLNVVPGHVLAIVGPNGSGKTTLFRALLGVVPPIAGEILISGLAPPDYRRKKGLGYLAEDTALPDGTCEGILALAAAAAGPDADVQSALILAGVDYSLDVPARKLSKGMKRRLALAAALMRPIRLLILDEPESGLDPGERHRLRQRIETIRGKTTILVASHDLGELALVSDHVLFVDRGRGKLLEQPEGGFTRNFLEEEFLALEGAVS